MLLDICGFMRQTLSALTAACLLALGQSAWASAAERTWLHQHARAMVCALSAAEQVKTAALLQQWHSNAPQPAAPIQRHLPFHPVMRAVATHLQEHYRQPVQSHQQPHTWVALHWVKADVKDLAVPPAPLNLEPAMVQRWASQWQQEPATSTL